ncbi:MAG: hypothetical protein IJU56_07675 [Clostridia bacterium]|nr:hypothetical protein [Clostridia bacterium]
MQKIGRIDIAIYQRVSNKAILTDGVVLTNNRMEHIKERRGLSFYETYRPLFSEIIRDPDYVFPDKRPYSVIVSKAFPKDGSIVNIIIRLVVESDNPKFKNSIITAIELGEERFEQFLRNNEPVYKKLDNQV